MAEKSGSGCLKSCAVGCASIVALVAVLAAGAWFGRDSLRQLPWIKKISETVETAKSEAVQLQALSARLRERYGAGQVTAHANIESTNGRTVKTLVVVFVGPGSALPEATAGREAAARAVAGAIAADYPTLDYYDRLHLRFVEPSTGGASLGSTVEFEFPVAEILARPAG
jgi:hypothetical protein